MRPGRSRLGGRSATRSRPGVGAWERRRRRRPEPAGPGAAGAGAEPQLAGAAEAGYSGEADGLPLEAACGEVGTGRNRRRAAEPAPGCARAPDAEAGSRRLGDPAREWRRRGAPVAGDATVPGVVRGSWQQGTPQQPAPGHARAASRRSGVGLRSTRRSRLELPAGGRDAEQSAHGDASAWREQGWPACAWPWTCSREQVDERQSAAQRTRVRGSGMAEESESGRWAACVRELGSRREGEVGRRTAQAAGSGEGRRANPAEEARGRARSRPGREAASGPSAGRLRGHGDATASGRRGCSRTPQAGAERRTRSEGGQAREELVGSSCSGGARRRRS
nr:spidroin-1-like [Aegilops tauschii subsp. strangulata]